MTYFISCEWMEKGFRHFLGTRHGGVLIKAKTHKKLLKKIVSWLNEVNLDSIIAQYDCDNTHVRIHKDGRIAMDTENRIMFVFDSCASIDAFMASFGSRTDEAPNVDTTQRGK